MLVPRRAALAAAALALAASIFPAPPALAAPVPGTTCSVFPADNIWNTDISGLPVNVHSDAWLASSGASGGRLLHPDFGSVTNGYGIPFSVVDNTHPTATYTFTYAGESDGGPYPYGSDLPIEAGSDAHRLVVNRDTCKLYETFATDSSGPQTAGSGAIFDLGSDALRPAGWTSADAAGLPIFPGLVRRDEVAAGAINHAIRFTVATTDRSYLWPARHQAGSVNDANVPPMGARFRLKAGYDISGFGPEARVVLTAMEHYGLIVADNGSDWYFQGTSDNGWDQPPYDTMVAQLKTVPASAFEAVDESGLMVSPDSGQARPPAPPPVATSSYFTWYDDASPGVLGDNIHLVNPDPSATAQVVVRGPGAARPVTLGPDQETYLGWPGARGGPVSVEEVSGPHVLASQRVQYYQSFNEIPAQRAVNAATSLWLPWFDRTSSPGFRSDDIYVANPQTVTANVTAAIPPCSPQSQAVVPDGFAVFTCGNGYGGPVHITADQPVLASQRVLYYQSFNETLAQPDQAAATDLYMTWFDRLSSPGFLNDNVHIVNPGGTAVQVTVSVPGCRPQTRTIGAQAGDYFTCPGGFGGPVHVTSSGRVLAAQRVQYYQTFNEASALRVASATPHSVFTWFDRISSVGFKGDNVHVLNTGAVTAQVSVSIPGCTGQPPVSVPAGQETYVTCASGFGGPVLVSSTQPVLASQRVQYFESFNEVAGSNV